ncbi:MAG: hypothetical protein OQK47_03020 [Gammaproteobacteria bacterium]|nr:hypothetical protein [Gammaproteobacteria bacterium]
MSNNIQLELHCSLSIRNILIEAIQTYARLIRPEPSSIYNEKSKNEIFSTLQYIRHPDNEYPMTISLNLYQQLCSAINFHYDRVRKELNTSAAKQNQLLLNAINGAKLTDQHLDEAIQKDLIF